MQYIEKDDRFTSDLRQRLGEDNFASLCDEYALLCLRNAGNGNSGHAANAKRSDTLHHRVVVADPDPLTHDAAVSNVSLLDHALYYARYGLYVFPVFEIVNARCACNADIDKCKAGKHPRVKGGFKSATLDAQTIHRWWSRWPKANIGIATGMSNLVAIDVDPGGIAAWEAMLADDPQLRAGLLQRTGRGGSHYVFRHDHGVEPIGNTESKLSAKIDVRGFKGYIVAAPSSHKNGQFYALVGDVAAIPELPQSLCRRLQSLGRTEVPKAHRVRVAVASVQTDSSLRPWHQRRLTEPWTHDIGTFRNCGRILALAREHLRRSPVGYEDGYIADLVRIRDNSPQLWERTQSGRKENPVDKEIRKRTLLRYAERHPANWEPIDTTDAGLLTLRRDARKRASAVYEALATYAMLEGIPRSGLSMTYARIAELLGGTDDPRNVFKYVRYAERAGLIAIVDRGLGASKNGIPATFAVRAAGEAHDEFLDAVNRERASRTFTRRHTCTPDDGLHGWTGVFCCGLSKA